MAGLVPAIHVFARATREDVDARAKPGHDGGEPGAICFNIVIASASEAIQNLSADSFWIASSLPLLAMTIRTRRRVLATKSARVVLTSPPSETRRAQGRPGAG
jgi:hypothetical protein